MGKCLSCGDQFEEYKNFCPKCSSGDVNNNPVASNVENESGSSNLDVIRLNEDEISKFKTNEVLALTIPIFGLVLSFIIFSVGGLYGLLPVVILVPLCCISSVIMLVISANKLQRFSATSILGLMLNAIIIVTFLIVVN